MKKPFNRIRKEERHKMIQEVLRPDIGYIEEGVKKS
jgi:hypothetical protein